MLARSVFFHVFTIICTSLHGVIASNTNAPNKPNIILIVADDLVSLSLVPNLLPVFNETVSSFVRIFTIKYLHPYYDTTEYANTGKSGYHFVHFEQ